MAGRGKGTKSKRYLRIIGGRWRGRKLAFSPAPGLRPTGDRVRETLFNWLAADLPGARCIDLFAGSGALGLEALSRGAEHCDFVDCSTAAIRDIAGHLATLDASARAYCQVSTAEEFVKRARSDYDLVFLDPPFDSNLLDPILANLPLRLLRPGAAVYVESAATSPPPIAPRHWQLHRDQRAGEVRYQLFRLPQQADL